MADHRDGDGEGGLAGQGLGQAGRAAGDGGLLRGAAGVKTIVKHNFEY